MTKTQHSVKMWFLKDGAGSCHCVKNKSGKSKVLVKIGLKFKNVYEKAMLTEKGTVKVDKTLQSID